MNNFESPTSPNLENPPSTPNSIPVNEVAAPVSKSCFSPAVIFLSLIIILLTGATGYLFGYFTQQPPVMETSDGAEIVSAENGQNDLNRELAEADADMELVDQQNWINTVRGIYSLSHPADWMLEPVSPDSVEYFGGDYLILSSPDKKVSISITPEVVPMGFGGSFELLDSENYHVDVMGQQVNFPEMVIKSEDGRHSVVINSRFSNCLGNDPTSGQSCDNWDNSKEMKTTHVLILTTVEAEGPIDGLTSYESYLLYKPVIKQILSTLEVEI